MDFQALLYSPAHLLLGVDAQLVVDGTMHVVRAIDKTSGIDTGDAVHGQTILPAAIVRVQELKNLGLDVKKLGSASTFICLNGSWWSVVTYRMRPTPNGESDGEVYLLLDKNGAPAQAASTIANRSFDFQSLLFEQGQNVFGTKVLLLLSGAEFNISGIDKTSGIDIGETVKGQTILPACVLRAQEYLALGLQYSALGSRSAFLKLNHAWWRVVTYRMRPGPYGEDDGEIYLLLSSTTVVEMPAVEFLGDELLDAALDVRGYEPDILFADLADDLVFDASLSVAWMLNAVLTDDTGLDATPLVTTSLTASIVDDTGLSAAPLVTTSLTASVADDTGLAAALLVTTTLNAVLADDASLAATPLVTTSLTASIADDTGLSATPLETTLLTASVADDTGLAAALLVTTALTASVVDDTGLAAAPLVTTSLTASVADDTGLGASLSVAWTLSAALADDTGLAATPLVTTRLVASIADDTGLAATVTTTIPLSASLADDVGLTAQLLATTSLTAAIADDTGLDAALSVTTTRINPAFVNAGVGKLNTASSSSIAIALPASLVVGNLLIAFIQNAGVAVTSGPAGWTKIEDATITSGFQTAWYRYVTGTESGTQTFSTAGGTTTIWAGVICQYSHVRSAGAGGPIGAKTTSTGSASPRTIPALTTTDVNSTLVIGGAPAGASGNFGAVTGFSVDFNINGASSSTGETVYHMAMGSTGTANTAWNGGGTGGAVWDAVIFELIAA